MDCLCRNSLLFVAPSAYPLGGVAVWLDYLLPGLQALGWNSKLAVPDGRHHDWQGYRAAYPKLELLRVTNPTGSSEGRVRSLCSLVRSVKPTIVVSVNIPDLFVAISRMEHEQGSCPLCVMTVHGLQEEFFLDAQRYAQSLDAVIATNHLTCELLRQVDGIESNRVHYAPYGVAIPDANRATRAESCAFTFAFVGRFEEKQKRLMDFAAIVREVQSRLDDFVVIVAGDGPDRVSFERALNDAAPGKVRFLGPLSPADVADQVYRVADALLVTSSWETGPIVIWEAMAHGIAVVSSRYVGSRAENALRHKENCLLFDIGDCAAAASELVSLKNPGQRRMLAAAGRRLVEDRYSRTTSVSAWSEVFERILHLERRPVADASYPLSCQGKLDRLFGVRAGETVRRLTAKRFLHQDAGGEWPHSHSRACNMDDFLSAAADLDAPK